MMEPRKIVFATNNPNKIKEIKEIVGEGVEIISLREIGCCEELPETSDTIAGNALMKARYVSEKYGYECFADDTGLEVEVLGGAPGVHTARYASTEGDDAASNMSLLLRNMEGAENRRARFVTCIALVEKGGEKLFEGICNGLITEKPSGSEGFGYDPVFRPEGSEYTFAEMSSESKNLISHRGKATRKLIEYLLDEKQA